VVLTLAVDRIQSPLVGFALAKALESHVTALPASGDQAQREVLLSRTTAALDRAAELLQSRRMQDRYPHLASAVEASRARMATADAFQEQAAALRSRGDLAGALAVAADGLKRHPRSQVLWQLHLEMGIEQARRGDAGEEGYEALLRQVAQAARAGMIQSYQHNFYSGVLLERLGNDVESLAAYEDALAAAATPHERIRTRAKVSELRIRLAAADR
jgi:hypothetical protein